MQDRSDSFPGNAGDPSAQGPWLESEPQASPFEAGPAQASCEAVLPSDAALPAAGAAPVPPAAVGARRRERSGTLEALLLVVFAFLMALSLKTYVAEAYEIKGNSMKPTFQNGQRVVVLKAFYGLQRGDIVVFASREDPGKDLIKRIVGLPGETVQIRQGHVLIDGKPLEESYVLGEDRGRFTSMREPEQVPQNSYYVLGDNRPDSHDSRFFHAIPADCIKGKVVVRWWPVNEFQSY